MAHLHLMANGTLCCHYVTLYWCKLVALFVRDREAIQFLDQNSGDKFQSDQSLSLWQITNALIYQFNEKHIYINLS